MSILLDLGSGHTHPPQREDLGGGGKHSLTTCLLKVFSSLLIKAEEGGVILKLKNPHPR